MKKINKTKHNITVCEDKVSRGDLLMILDGIVVDVFALATWSHGGARGERWRLALAVPRGAEGVLDRERLHVKSNYSVSYIIFFESH